MEYSLLSPRRYVGRYPGTLPPRYPLESAARAPRLPNKKYVLLVDDDPFFRSLFKVMLRQTGWEVAEIWEAEDSHTALALFRTRIVDLVFCDFNLPAMSSKDG